MGSRDVGRAGLQLGMVCPGMPRQHVTRCAAPPRALASSLCLFHLLAAPWFVFTLPRLPCAYLPCAALAGGGRRAGQTATVTSRLAATGYAGAAARVAGRLPYAAATGSAAEGWAAACKGSATFVSDPGWACTLACSRLP